MEKELLIELTYKVYRLTLLFPKKEPLRQKIRETADELLKDLVAWQVFHSQDFYNLNQKEILFNIKKNFEIIFSYFEVAKWQNWVSYFDILELREEYGKIKERFENEEKEEQRLNEKQETIIFPKKEEQEEKQTEKQTEPKESKKPERLDPRKGKILDILREKERVQVWEVKKILADVSKRTLRRDFEKLLKQGLIERIGQRNDTFYRLKN